jgi:hypothetical protein
VANCETCNTELTPLSSYGPFPATLCFGCWNRHEQGPRPSILTPQRQAEENLRRCEERIQEIGREMRVAEYNLSAAKTQLAVFFQHQSEVL